MSEEDHTEDDIARIARKFALLNSTQHGGRAELKAVVGRILSERADLRKESKKVSSVASREVSYVNSLMLADQHTMLSREFPEALSLESERKDRISKRDSDVSRKVLPDLPHAVPGGVITRFPPEPNGYMHIGHAKAAWIGRTYATQYGGRFIVRFDDTNPAAEKREYYAPFLESLEWLGIRADVVRNASDDMGKFYELAEKLLETGRGYICTCSKEKMQELRSSGEECDHRERAKEENLELWNEMLRGTIAKNEAVLRFRGDMKSLNTAMRDPVLFRIVDAPHPLRGSEFRVWPTYDFDGPVEDSLDGVTHAMRSKEYELRDELYHAILKALELREPEIIEFSRLSLQGTTVHKRTLRPLIESGKVEGWNDPRLPTIAGLRRRGILPETIREFILSMGVSKVETQPTWDLLESINRKLLDPLAKRFFFVPNPVPLKVEGMAVQRLKLRNHPDRKDLGERFVEVDGDFAIPSDDARSLKIGDKIRLIEACNVEITKGSVNSGSLTGRQVPEGQMPKRIQWVSTGESIPWKAIVLGPLLLPDDTFNENSLKIVEGLAEKSLASMPVGEIVQFVRFGFSRIDTPGMSILVHK